VRLGGGLVMSPSTPLSAENHGGRLVVQTRAGLLVMGIQPVDDGDQFPRASHDLADEAETRAHAVSSEGGGARSAPWRVSPILAAG
jgi:hypothetical protein